MTSSNPALATATALALALTAGGCSASALSPTSNFRQVRADVRERSGQEIARRSPEASPATASSLRKLLEDGLSGEDALRIALLNNRELQVLYADLDVAESDLLQASLLHNPVADVALGFPLEGGLVDLSFGLAVDVIDLLYVPLRKRVATAALEETKLQIAAEVLDLVGRVRTTFHRHQSNAQLVEMRRQVAQATALGLDLAQRMRRAGNVTALEVATEDAIAAGAQLDLRMAEMELRETREALNRLLGLWGADTTWTLAETRLPEPPSLHAEGAQGEDLESRAVERSLDLAMAAQRVIAAGEQLGLTESSALFPEVLGGGEASREGDWELGPTFSIPLPFFDRGQARIARAQAELRRARDLHHATAVHLRSVLRAARDRTAGHLERVHFQRSRYLPLTESIVRETQLQLNAMQLTPFDLLRAKEGQIEAGAHYIESLRDYWLSRDALDLILAGRMPPMEGGHDGADIDSPRRSSIPTLN